MIRTWLYKQAPVNHLNVLQTACEYHSSDYSSINRCPSEKLCCAMRQSARFVRRTSVPWLNGSGIADTSRDFPGRMPKAFRPSCECSIDTQCNDESGRGRQIAGHVMLRESTDREAIRSSLPPQLNPDRQAVFSHHQIVNTSRTEDLQHR